MNRQFQLNDRHVRRRFDRAAASFDATDFVHGVARDGLFQRLEPVLVEARTIIDLGCATGKAIPLLQKRFRRARVVGVDTSAAMLARAGKRRGWFSGASVLQADARRLPFDDHSIDLVFANLLLPWIDDLGQLGRELCRVLRKDGLFVFSTLGPDSLLPLRRAWASADEGEHVLPFADMHDVGDALVGAGLSDPVVDVDRLDVTYEQPQKLFDDLTACGARNALAGRRATLTGPGRLQRVREALRPAGENAVIRIDLELVYGHCWGRGGQPRAGEVHIDPTSIPLRRSRP